MKVKVAGVQMDVTFAEPEKNLGRFAESLKATCAAGAKLTVFPECALTGYCYESLDEARSVAEPIPGPSSERMAAPVWPRARSSSTCPSNTSVTMTAPASK